MGDVEKVRATLCHGCGNPICPGCGNSIDPSVCGCGAPGGVCRPDHDGHSFIPMGCGCYRADPPHPETIYELWAIRRKSDGWMLPSGRKRGFTHDEPVDPAIHPPRLFTKAASARAALRRWLEGETVVTRSPGGAYLDDVDEDWQTRPRPDRKADDMEVVVVRWQVQRGA